MYLEILIHKLGIERLPINNKYNKHSWLTTYSIVANLLFIQYKPVHYFASLTHSL